MLRIGIYYYVDNNSGLRGNEPQHFDLDLDYDDSITLKFTVFDSQLIIIHT